MKFTKKHGWLLIGVGLWNFYCYANFTRNLINGHQRGDVHPNGYYIAHTALIVINVLIGVVLVWLGAKALKAAKQTSAADA